jgi:hypothetical protein
MISFESNESYSQDNDWNSPNYYPMTESQKLSLCETALDLVLQTLEPLYPDSVPITSLIRAVVRLPEQWRTMCLVCLSTEFRLGVGILGNLTKNAENEIKEMLLPLMSEENAVILADHIMTQALIGDFYPDL